MMDKYPIIVLISGNGSNLQAMIDAIQNGAPYQIAAVISNNPDAYGLTRAKLADIPTHVIDHHDFASRDEFDQALINVIDSYPHQLIALAGFMRRLGNGLVDHYLGQMINIHPSLLPKYPGLNTHQQVLDNKDTEHGASIHFVTAELDSGPIISQIKTSIKPEQTVDILTKNVHAVEHDIYPRVLTWFAENRISWNQAHPLFDGELMRNEGILLKSIKKS